MAPCGPLSAGIWLYVYVSCWTAILSVHTGVFWEALCVLEYLPVVYEQLVAGFYRLLSPTVIFKKRRNFFRTDKQACIIFCVFGRGCPHIMAGKPLEAVI